jgi:fructose-bisphosphate aldolase class 1
VPIVEPEVLMDGDHDIDRCYGATEWVLKGFIDQILWTEFVELDRALQAYLHEVTLRVIREEVYADASEAQEVSEALPPN